MSYTWCLMAEWWLSRWGWSDVLSFGDMHEISTPNPSIGPFVPININVYSHLSICPVHFHIHPPIICLYIGCPHWGFHYRSILRTPSFIYSVRRGFVQRVWRLADGSWGFGDIVPYAAVALQKRLQIIVSNPRLSDPDIELLTLWGSLDPFSICSSIK